MPKLNKLPIPTENPPSVPIQDVVTHKSASPAVLKPSDKKKCKKKGKKKK